jgi:membrane-bound lytic murein transglycosylase B
MPSSSRRSTRSAGWLRLALVIAALLVAAGAWTALISRVDVLGDRIPAVALDAYRSASEAAPDVAEGCQVGWRVLAAIGKVESDHGRVGEERTLDRDGTISPPIRGASLDGTAGRQAIHDTDGGLLDGDALWDRAMGPLQFIPTTWSELGRDGNRDGRADPDNLYDAALTAVAHLCTREPGDYARRDDLRRALISYNASQRYADEVLAWVDRYAGRTERDLVAPS